jgi:hypothetical protein
MEGWSFLTNHARVLLCIAHDPGGRLRDIGARMGITERSACGIVAGLAAAGYAVKQKGGRCNRYQIRAGMPLPGPAGRRLAIGEVLAVLAGAGAGRALSGGNLAEATTASRAAGACGPRSLSRKRAPGEPRRFGHVPAAGAAAGSVVPPRARHTWQCPDPP